MLDILTVIDNFNTWMNRINSLILTSGDLTTLTTTDKTSLVNSVNELVNSIEDLSVLTTTDKSSLINAINEVHTGQGDLTLLTTNIKLKLIFVVNELDSDSGDLATLTTTDKTSLVGAINEIHNNQGDVTTLTTTDKSSLVGAVNELDYGQGDLTTLTTTDKTSLVGAVNELDSIQGDVTTLTTTDKSSLVGAVNELDSIQGDLTTLTTTDKTSLVGAVNELDYGQGDLTTLTTTDKTSLVGAVNSISKPNLKNYEPYTRCDTADLSSKLLSSNRVPLTTQIYEPTTTNFRHSERFIDNNATNGGSGDYLDTVMESLLATMGNSTRRYGYEWNIVALQVNDSIRTISVDGFDWRTGNQNNNLYLGEIGDVATWAGWVMLINIPSGSPAGLILGNYSGITTWVDDVLVGVNAPYRITTIQTWHHVRMQITLSSNSSNFFPDIYTGYKLGSTSGSYYIALPRLYRGDVEVLKADHINI